MLSYLLTRLFFLCLDNRGGRDWNVEAGEQAMGPQLTVLSEVEAAALLAKRPDAASSVANVVSPSPSLSHDSSSYLQLQQLPFKLKGANKGVHLSAVNIPVTYMYTVAHKKVVVYLR